MDVILYRLLISILLSLIILSCLYFLNKNFKKSNENFFITLMAAPIICTILLGIGSSVPRAFGLFAALSIIRLRAPIKDTLDMAFIFASVGMGICCGAGAINVALVGCAFFVTSVLCYTYYFSSVRKKEFYYIEIKSKHADIQKIKDYFDSKTELKPEFLSKRSDLNFSFINYNVFSDETIISTLESSLKNLVQFESCVIEKQSNINHIT